METSMTPGQKKQLSRFGGIIVIGLTVIITSALASPKPLSTPNQFADEEKPSNYGYPKGWELKPLAEQAAILAGKFPGLDVSHVEELARRYEKDGKLVLPEGMDGLLVIPKHSAVARLTKDNEQWPAYNRALSYLFGVMKAARQEFVDYTEGAVGPDHEQLAAKTSVVYAELESVPGDALVLAVQTGFLHRGKSVRRARVVFGAKEFGLDSFAVGIIVLTHHERLNRSDVLWINCAGSERMPGAGDAFTLTSFWRFNVRRLRFGSFWLSLPHVRYGSASGARPE